MQMIFPEGLNRNHPNRERESEHFDVAPLDWINLGVIEVGIGASGAAWNLQSWG